MIDPSNAAGWGTAFVAFSMAAFERIKSSKVQSKTVDETETLSLAKAAREKAELMFKMAEEYKALLEQERIDHKKTRDYWHAENGKSQDKLSAANLKVLELQDRPDLRDILSALKKQGEGIQEQGEGIKQILLHLIQNHKA